MYNTVCNGHAIISHNWFMLNIISFFSCTSEIKLIYQNTNSLIPPSIYTDGHIHVFTRPLLMSRKNTPHNLFRDSHMYAQIQKNCIILYLIIINKNVKFYMLNTSHSHTCSKSLWRSGNFPGEWIKEIDFVEL